MIKLKSISKHLVVAVFALVGSQTVMANDNSSASSGENSKLATNRAMEDYETDKLNCTVLQQGQDECLRAVEQERGHGSKGSRHSRS